MNCVLTNEQQKALLAQVAVDLASTELFSFEQYSKDFYNLVLKATNDKVLAANYVALLPMNIRAVMGVRKTIFAKLAKSAEELSTYESSFEDFANVEAFVNKISSDAKDLVQLATNIQKDSLTAPTEQENVVATKNIDEATQTSLFDMDFDVDKNNFLKPDMKVYADAKEQLIKNVKQDGTSLIGNTPVKLMMMSTKDFQPGDLYPDTKTWVLSGDPKAAEAIKNGVAVVVTDLKGNPIRVTNNLDISSEPESKLLYYQVRDPKPGQPLLETDRLVIQQLMRDQKLSQNQAQAVVEKQLNLLSKLREFVKKNPDQNKVNLNLIGGQLRISAKTSKTGVKVSAIDFSEKPFEVYAGIPAKGQKPNVYYFDYPGTTFPITINSPAIPADLRQKLVQLLTEDVYTSLGGETVLLAPTEKIKLFKQFIYTPPDVLDLSIDEAGNIVVKKLGVTTSYSTKESIVQDLNEFFTKVVPQRKVGTDFVKGKSRIKPINLKGAMPGQVLEMTNPDGTIAFYELGPFQLKINKTFVNSKYEDFTFTDNNGKLIINKVKKDYNDFIKANFNIGYDAPQSAGSTMNFHVAPEDFFKIVKSQKVSETKEVDKPTQYKGLSLEYGDIINSVGMHGAAQYNKTKKVIRINEPVLRQKYEDKAWTKPYTQKDGSVSKALPVDAFKTYEDFKSFIIEHEYQHSIIFITPEQSRGEYEDRINEEALNALQIRMPLFDDQGNLNPDIYGKKTDDKISGINNENVERKLTAKDKLLRLRKDDPDKFNKLIGQKGLQATLDQIDAAEKWYNNHPMAAYFPFDAMFDVVNQEDSDSIATWTSSGITLFKGADFTDLYHESWHGFTQGFLSKQQKTDLYQEMRNKSGSFVDYQGNVIQFKDASDLQVEEFLAEDFREYMLSGGKKVLQDSPKRNSIFRKIFNFLKKLFGTASIKQTVVDDQVTETVRELYEKLRVGDLSVYTFAAENRNFDTLNKALVAIDPKEGEKTLSYAFTNLIYETTESLFSEGIDVINAANVDDINERRSLEAKQNRTEADNKRLAELNAQGTSSYTTSMLSTEAGLKALYGYVKDQFEDKLAQTIEENAKNPSTTLEKKIDLLEYAIRNFGDVDNLVRNREGYGVIGYHLFKSDLIQSDLKDALTRQAQLELQEEEELAGREQEGKNYFDRGGNEASIFDLMNKEVRTIIKSLNKTRLDGSKIENYLGFPELVNYKQAFAYIIQTVQNAKDRIDMYNKLEAEGEKYPPIKQFLQKMGPVSYDGQTDREIDLWLKFYQSANKYRINLVQTTVTETFDTYSDGKPKGKSTFDIRVGNALNAYNNIDQDWQSKFRKTISEFIQNDTKGNYLVMNKVFDQYPTIESVNANPLQFLNDIGISMSELPVMDTELRKEIASGNIRLNGIYNNLTALNQKGITVRGIKTYLNDNPKTGVVGQTGPNSTYGKLLALQSRFSGEYSDFMVQNAAGDPQSEYSQNNTATVLTKYINSAKSYNELVSNKPTEHYNNNKTTAGRPYNPFVNASIWMNSLFDMGATKGTRKKDNEIVIENLSGVNSSINNYFMDGVALAEADEVGKFLNDLHVQLMRSTPELTRHAGKKTSLSIHLKRYNTGAKNPKMYIDTEEFVEGPGVYNYVQILKNYLGAELDRVNYCKYLLSPEAGVTEFDFGYLQRGTKFSAFAGVLSDSTKEQLYSVQGNLSEYLQTQEGFELNTQIEKDILNYFNGLVNEVDNKLLEYKFIAPSLIEKIKDDASKAGVSNDKLTPETLRRATASSFVANNWIHHFEEMIMFYGDVAQYSDFFKRNASLNATGDIVANDPFYVNYVNTKLGKPFSKQAGATEQTQVYNGILKSAVVADVLVKSVYLDEYQKTTDAPVITEKYGVDSKGNPGVNEADAQGLISFDTYRIILKGLGKWSLEQESIFQDLLAGKPASEIDVKSTFPTLKMGYYGPVQNSYLPLTGLHKFALFPLIPGAIPSNLQDLHTKMMKEGIDYLTFKSGSKVGTISKKGGLQPLYQDVSTRTLSEEPFVQNPIFVDYLKYQVENAPKFKGKMTLPTQLRKLADTGLLVNGVPTDYAGTKEEWEALNDKAKKEASINYTLRATYIDSLNNLVNSRKDALLKKIGWKRNASGEFVGDIGKMLEMVSTELKRLGTGDHEIAFIQTIGKNAIRTSLDISQSADQIEKGITSLINRELINVKINGEQLVMVSTTGFENKQFAYGTKRNFDNPTEEEKQKYGTNDLPTYHIRDGKIKAAKVKIAIQGNFKKLLTTKEVKDKAKELNISTLEALNTFLKDEEWLNKGNNRAMISMVGARIPTQGPNSADFVEVYEFLPEIAGNIIIAPSEVTSKGGSDFDFDKLPLMMPNIKVSKSGVAELLTRVTESEARELYNKLKDKTILNDDSASKVLGDIFGMDLGTDLTDEEVDELMVEQGKKSFAEFFSDLNSTKVAENELMQSLTAMLQQPQNFASLIRPNDTDIVKPFSDEIKKTASSGMKEGYEKEGTRMFEPMHNLKVQQANSVGKDTLGIGAIYNSFNSVLAAIGLELNPVYNEGNRRATLLFKHNQNKTGGISLSQTMDNLNENSVSDVVSQLINGWVDVEKDDWISYIQGNKEIAPVMLFMIRAGVPIKDVVKFVTSPIIKQYAEEKRMAKSSFAKALGRTTSKAYKKQARNEIFKKFGIMKPSTSDVFHIIYAYTDGIDDISTLDEAGLSVVEKVSGTTEKPILTSFADSQDLEKQIKSKRLSAPEFKNEIEKLFANISSPTEAKFLHRKFTVLTHPDKGGDVEFSQILNDTYDKYKAGSLGEGEKTIETKKKASRKVQDVNFVKFLHFLEIEALAGEIDAVQRAFNVDTTPLKSLTEFYGKISEIKDLENKDLIPQKYIKALKDNSPIGPFYVHEFSLDLFGRLLPLRNNKTVNEFLNQLTPSDINNLFDLYNVDSRVRFYQTFKNDLLQNIFQQEVRGFVDSGNYSNNRVSFDIKEVGGLKFGAFVKDGVLYADKEQIGNDYDLKAFSQSGYGNGILATVSDPTAFTNKNEYVHFVYERETLRSLYPFKSVNTSIEYLKVLDKNKLDNNLKLEGESVEDFNDRMDKLSYEQLLRDKALYNIFNPYQLFKAPNNVADNFVFIVEKYPKLKEHYSVIQNIKVSSADGYTNLMPSTLKYDGDEINVFHENLQKLANGNELLKIEGIDQQDADYISQYFKKLPMWLYMQSGANTRSAFSFARMLPQEKIRRLLNGPVNQLTNTIDEKYLNEFLTKFVVANSTSSKNRVKDFLKPDYMEKAAEAEPVEDIDEVVDDVEEPTITETSVVVEKPEPKIISDAEVMDFINKCFIR